MRELNVQAAKDTLARLVGGTIRYDAWGRYQTPSLHLSKGEHWSGWLNNVYELASIWPRDSIGRDIVANIKTTFLAQGWEIHNLIHGGISLIYKTMTKDEIDVRAHNNLIHGGRMSD